MKRRNRSREIEFEEYEDLSDEDYINEVMYNKGKGSKGRREKKQSNGILLGVMTFFLGIVIVVFAALLLFHIQKIEVTGNQYTTDNDIISWLKEDKYAVNSLYVLVKYNYTDVDKPVIMESCKFSLKNPWTLKASVKEKVITGYVEHEGKYLYFDEEGTAVLLSTEKIEGAAFIEGMDLGSEKVKMGEVLPVADKDVFKRIVEISQLFVKYELTADRITCTDGSINLYFGNVEVFLGKSNYEERLAQVKPILAKLSEQYPDQAGTLHLENYTGTDQSIRFVPKVDEPAAES